MTQRFFGETCLVMEEEFEDVKGVIRIRISMKNRQYNGQKKKDKGQTTIYKTYTCAPDGLAVHAPLVAPVVLIRLQAR